MFVWFVNESGKRRHDSDTAAIIYGTGRSLIIINTLIPTTTFDSAQSACRKRRARTTST
jgi:hypothetical protein